jgi:very-short-patch-repair endonuclease
VPRTDDYGNTRKINQQRERGRAPTVGRLRESASYLGGVPYAPFRRGRSRRGGVSAGDQDRPFPEPPPSWMGTLPEWAIYWAHGVLGRKEYQDFQYQYSFDGQTIFDFFEFDERIAIEVQGLYWHYEFEGHDLSQDILRKIRVESAGMTLIFIDEDHALADPVYYLREALAQRDHSRAATGKSL